MDNEIKFSYKEVAEALIKKRDLHEGIWSVALFLGIQGSNIGPTPEDVVPAAIVPVVNIGLRKVDKINSLSVDAGLVNPIPT